MQRTELTLLPGGPVGPGSPEAPGGPCTVGQETGKNAQAKIRTKTTF